MNAVREAWTDERLDDLASRVDKGFERVDVEFRSLRLEMNSRFDAMQRTMIIGFVSVIGSVVASVIGGLLATHL